MQFPSSSPATQLLVVQRQQAKRVPRAMSRLNRAFMGWAEVCPAGTASPNSIAGGTPQPLGAQPKPPEHILGKVYQELRARISLTSLSKPCASVGYDLFKMMSLDVLQCHFSIHSSPFPSWSTPFISL